MLRGEKWLMAHWTIRPREGVEVSVDDDNAVRIDQIAIGGKVPTSIVVQPDDVPRLIHFLDAARAQAIQNREDLEAIGEE